MNLHSSSEVVEQDDQSGQATSRSDDISSKFIGRRTLALYRSLLLGAVAGFLIGLLVGYSAGDGPLTRLPDPPSMAQCVADTANLFGRQNGPTPEVYRDARDHCYSLIESDELFRDAAIRKLNFLQQYRANGVLMWMVVAVTISGVLLAGLQLWASFRLAVLTRVPFGDNNSEIVVKRDQLVLKSSITGLLILVVSFCFFLVFVFYVYRFDTAANPTTPTLSPSSNFLPGGLGPPIEKKPP